MRCRSILSALARAWRRIEACLGPLHIEHKGFYSLERVQLLRHFVSRSNGLHNLLVVAATPLPTLAITLICDCIPLASPRDGALANYAYWARAWIAIAAFTLSVLCTVHYCTPQLPQSWPRLLFMTVVVASLHVSAHFAISMAIGFPVPFAYLIMNVPWISLICAALWIHMGPQRRADPDVRLRLKKLGIAIYVSSSLAVVYPLFYHLFLLLKDNPTGQFFFTFVLPVIKLLEKLLLNHFTKYMEDAQPVMVSFNIEVFNALFVSCCMQNANSQATSVALMVMDFLGATYALVRLGDLTATIDVLSAKMGVSRCQMLDVATAIVHSNPDVLVWRHTPISTTGFPTRHALVGESKRVFDAGTRPEPAAPGVSPIVSAFPRHRIMTIQRATTSSGIVAPAPALTPVSIPVPRSHSDQSLHGAFGELGSPSKHPELKASAVAPATLAPPPSALNSGDQELIVSSQVIERLSIKERKKFVKETLKVLRRTEFLLLIEYTEVIVPIVYYIYLNVIYPKENRKYFPYMVEMTEDEFVGTTNNIALYGGLQLFSFVLLIIVLEEKFEVPAIGQVAFALQTQWQLVHPLLVLWILYSLQSSLEHVGTDYTFKFEWLRSSTNT